MQELIPGFSCIATKEEFEQAKNDWQRVYVLQDNGKYMMHTKLSHNRYLQLEVKEIAELKAKKPTTGFVKPAPIKQEINFLPAGKIPMELLDQVEAFFRQVMKVQNDALEAMVHILWNPTKGYFISVPNQTISKASVKYENDHIEAGDMIIVDIHSHNTMSAFFSGTDDADDKNGVYYSGVFGYLQNAKPMTVWRFNFNDVKLEATIDDIFESPMKELPEVNEDWIKKVSLVRTPVYQGYPATYQRGQGRNYGHQGSWMDRELPRVNRGNGFPTSDDFNFDEQNEQIYGDTTGWGENWGRYEPDSKSGVVKPIGLLTSTKKIQSHNGSPIISLSDVAAQRDGMDDGEYAEIAVEWGPDVADIFTDIRDQIPDLQDCDDLLLALIRTAYDYLTPNGQVKIASEGM